jgi:hypothetical protein
MTKKYEYRQTRNNTKPEDFVERLESFNEEGWEVVSVYNNFNDRQYALENPPLYILWRREINENS